MIKYQVLFHLDEGNTFRLKLTLENIRNLIRDLGAENVEVECVINGAGVKLFHVSTAMEEELIDILTAKSVRFAICENSLVANRVQKQDLLDGLVFVPSGVGELVKKQAEGWAYIKP